jgi:hypothetical protein
MGSPLQGKVPMHRKSKLDPEEDGPFQVLEKYGDNTYKIDLSGEYNISATFNVSDLSSYDVGDDSRSNQLQEGTNDRNQPSMKDNHKKGERWKKSTRKGSEFQTQ